MSSQFLLEHYSIGFLIQFIPSLKSVYHLSAELNKLKVITFRNYWWEVSVSSSLITSWELTGFTDVLQIYSTSLCTNELSWRSGLLTFKWVYLAHCSVYLNERCSGALKLNDLLCSQVREGNVAAFTCGWGHMEHVFQPRIVTNWITFLNIS